ncbi:MAG: hypothetical protein FWG55_03970 [Candidatus Bathyarchaeota archaeon]|nr:hypothetical protein [Candidatus Termiticorpusculum sp.]
MVEEYISKSLMESVPRVLFRVIWVFEPFAPTAITFYINQRLRHYKESSAICNYKAHTKRLGKFRYRISMDIDLTGKQAIRLAGNVFPNHLRQFRRWFS